MKINELFETEKENALQIRNNKTGQILYMDYTDIELLFNCDSFQDNNILLSELKEHIKIQDSLEDIMELLDYWNDTNRTVYNDDKKYYIDMVEYITYSSETGSKSEFQVIE